MANGANVHSQSSEYKSTALHDAASNGHEKAIAALVFHGALSVNGGLGLSQWVSKTPIISLHTHSFTHSVGLCVVSSSSSEWRDAQGCSLSNRNSSAPECPSCSNDMRLESGSDSGYPTYECNRCSVNRTGERWWCDCYNDYCFSCHPRCESVACTFSPWTGCICGKAAEKKAAAEKAAAWDAGVCRCD